METTIAETLPKITGTRTESKKPDLVPYSNEEIQRAILKLKKRALERRQRYDKNCTEKDIKLSDRDNRDVEMMILQDRALREYAKKINRVPEVKKKYSAEELSGLFQQKYQIFDETREIVWQMCLYFAQDNRCELNLEKGLLLAGGVGCGKTTLMRFFANIQPNHYQMKSVREISYEYAEHGEMILKSYSNGAYCFDDMGTESNKKHFGNESNVLEDIISNRYDSESLTHITTNLRSEDIEEAYGIRVRSRLRSMVNLIDFKNAKDLRK